MQSQAQSSGKGKGKCKGKSKAKENTKAEKAKGYQQMRKWSAEQLKQRTRCARCGNIRHWARECTHQSDDRSKDANSGKPKGFSNNGLAVSLEDQPSLSRFDQSIVTEPTNCQPTEQTFFGTNFTYPTAAAISKAQALCLPSSKPVPRRCTLI